MTACCPLPEEADCDGVGPDVGPVGGVVEHHGGRDDHDAMIVVGRCPLEVEHVDLVSVGVGVSDCSLVDTVTCHILADVALNTRCRVEWNVPASDWRQTCVC